jgi:hypothetical protein
VEPPTVTLTVSPEDWGDDGIEVIRQAMAALEIHVDEKHNVAPTLADGEESVKPKAHPLIVMTASPESGTLDGLMDWISYFDGTATMRCILDALTL